MGFKIKFGMLRKYNEDKNMIDVIVPDDVITIGNGAFKHCQKIVRVTLPASVETIADYAFYGCKNLTEIIVKGELKSIGHSAFDGCPKLKNKPEIKRESAPKPAPVKSEVSKPEIKPPAIRPKFLPVESEVNKPEIKPEPAPVEKLSSADYENTLQQFREHPEDKAVCKVISDHATEFVSFLIQHFELGSLTEEQTIRMMIQTGNMITPENVSDMIQEAIANQAYGIQTELSRYKARL